MWNTIERIDDAVCAVVKPIFGFLLICLLIVCCVAFVVSLLTFSFHISAGTALLIWLILDRGW